jgi:F-type H+-transporting ATPase subunit gamma
LPNPARRRRREPRNGDRVSGATEALGRKMAAAKDLSAVVRSMKALAASSITQYERSVDALTDYYRTVELALSVCLRERPAVAPLATPAATGAHAATGKPAPRAAIIFGSDQGLVGRFNEVLMEYTAHTLASLPGKTHMIWTVGERMQAIVTDAGLPRPVNFPVPVAIHGITPLVGKILIAIEAELKHNENCEIYVFHNQPLAAAGYQPVSKRLLPLDASWQRDLARLPWPGKRLPEVIGDTTAALAAFIRGYLFVLLFQACAQSLASENASRLAAMQRAEQNIADLLGDLTRNYHRLRQESIDEELREVISGYEAASPGKN